MTTAWSYPLGTTRLSRVFGGTGLKVNAPFPTPPSGRPKPAASGTTGVAGAAPAGAAPATAPPKPRTSAPTAPARTTPRRDTSAFTTSAKYALSEVLGTGWSHALPHR